MPTSRKGNGATLSAAWKYLLENGTMPPDSLILPDDDLVSLYRAWHPRSRSAESRWKLWGPTILAAWRRAGRPGKPWGCKFDGAQSNGHP